VLHIGVAAAAGQAGEQDEHGGIRRQVLVGWGEGGRAGSLAGMLTTGAVVTRHASGLLRRSTGESAARTAHSAQGPAAAELLTQGEGCCSCCSSQRLLGCSGAVLLLSTGAAMTTAAVVQPSTRRCWHC
jgi:hypothetical protein